MYECELMASLPDTILSRNRLSSTGELAGDRYTFLVRPRVNRKNRCNNYIDVTCNTGTVSAAKTLSCHLEGTKCVTHDTLPRNFCQSDEIRFLRHDPNVPGRIYV
eukprot:c10614_g1_i1.p1 GENE.c10614_g1_i1~~c10614_g1_i1.p1  ORF type:complete len:105 (-),score=3.59 c10614_g1_i1:46-360(-)